MDATINRSKIEWSKFRQ